MPEFRIDDLEISPSEFVDSCDRWEIKELVDCLVEEDLVIRKQGSLAQGRGYDETTYEEALVKLSGRWNMLTTAESEFIANIAKRF
jgi:hypothetical protein